MKKIVITGGEGLIGKKLKAPEILKNDPRKPD